MNCFQILERELWFDHIRSNWLTSYKQWNHGQLYPANSELVKILNFLKVYEREVEILFQELMGIPLRSSGEGAETWRVVSSGVEPGRAFVADREEEPSINHEIMMIIDRRWGSRQSQLIIDSSIISCSVHQQKNYGAISSGWRRLRNNIIVIVSILLPLEIKLWNFKSI